MIIREGNKVLLFGIDEGYGLTLTSWGKEAEEVENSSERMVFCIWLR